MLKLPHFSRRCRFRCNWQSALIVVVVIITDDDCNDVVTTTTTISKGHRTVDGVSAPLLSSTVLCTGYAGTRIRKVHIIAFCYPLIIYFSAERAETEHSVRCVSMLGSYPRCLFLTEPSVIVS